MMSDNYHTILLVLYLLTACNAEMETEQNSNSGLESSIGGIFSEENKAQDNSEASDFYNPENVQDGGTASFIFDEQFNTSNIEQNQSDNCGEVSIEPIIQYIPGNLIVVFDRSMSMHKEFVPGVTRLQAAYQSLMDGLMPFVCAQNEPDCEEQINVASILFPSAPSSVGACYVEGIDSLQQINWMSATQFVAEWKSYWLANPYPDQSLLVYGTPITIAFQQADDAIQGANLLGNTAVLFLTDGEGTCDMGTPADVQAAAWIAQGIKTHVVSVASEVESRRPSGDGQNFNDLVASAGGTDISLNPSDVETLNAAFQSVIQSAATAPSCQIPLQGGRLNDLNMACERGTVTVGGEAIACDQQNQIDGFWLPSEDLIELVGSACDRLKSMGQISAIFPCDLISEPH